MTSLSPPHKAVDTRPTKEMVERATRIAAMLGRWSADDVSDEPEWSIEDLEPMTLRPGAAPATRRP